MEETDIAFLQNLSLKYSPQVILEELSYVYSRRANAYRQALEPGQTSNIQLLRAKKAFELISDFSGKLDAKPIEPE